MRHKPASGNGRRTVSLHPVSDRAPADRQERRLALAQFLPYRLNVLASEVSLGLSRIYAKRHGIGIPEWRVIATLGEIDRAPARDIGHYTRMHKTKVSRAVACLAERGLLARETNALDQREAILSLTPAGRRLYAGLVPLALDFEHRLLLVLDDNERRAFDMALAKLSAEAERLVG